MSKKSPKFPLPKNEAEINQYITDLAEAQIAADRAVTRANQKMQTIKAALGEELSVHEALIKDRMAALFAYFEANRDELTDGGKRESCVFATGILGQRRTPPRTQFKDESAVEAFVVQHRMTSLYEEKIVLRRDAMLANRPLAETIPGVSFVCDRIVYVKPDLFDVVIDLKKKVESAK